MHRHRTPGWRAARRIAMWLHRRARHHPAVKRLHPDHLTAQHRRPVVPQHRPAARRHHHRATALVHTLGGSPSSPQYAPVPAREYSSARSAPVIRTTFDEEDDTGQNSASARCRSLTGHCPNVLGWVSSPLEGRSALERRLREGPASMERRGVAH